MLGFGNRARLIDVKQFAETLLLIKSSRGLFNDLRAEIERLNSNEVPEAIAIPIVDGLERYLEWMAGVLRNEQDA